MPDAHATAPMTPLSDDIANEGLNAAGTWHKVQEKMFGGATENVMFFV